MDESSDERGYTEFLLESERIAETLERDGINDFTMKRIVNLYVGLNDYIADMVERARVNRYIAKDTEMKLNRYGMHLGWAMIWEAERYRCEALRAKLADLMLRQVEQKKKEQTLESLLAEYAELSEEAKGKIGDADLTFRIAQLFADVGTYRRKHPTEDPAKLKEYEELDKKASDLLASMAIPPNRRTD